MGAKIIARVMSMLVAGIVIASVAMADTVIEYTYDAAGNPTKVEIKTDPANADTDGDGMPDWWETRYGLNPSVNDAGGDLDADGLTNLQEFQQGTHPNKADTDNDGMPDNWEVSYGLNPVVNDARSDKDNDGLQNIEEYRLGTLPNNADTDGDGMPDGWEVQYGLNPLANDAAGDLDSDGLTNLAEYQAGSNPNSSNTVAVDITADPETMSSGNSSTLTWSAVNASSCSITPDIGTVATSGSKLVAPTQTTAYTITATGAAGTAQDSTTITVTAAPRPTVTAWYTPDRMQNDNCSPPTLHWTSTNADKVCISAYKYPVQCFPAIGSTVVRITYGSGGPQYTITAYGPGGTATVYVTPLCFPGHW